MKDSKALIAAFALAAVLAALVGTASAHRLAVSETHFRVTWGTLTFEFGFGFGQAVCPAMMEGSFHSRTISKVAESLIGYVTRASISSSCPQVLTATLPWHVRYEGFSGTLPLITRIRGNVVNLALLWEGGGFRCLYEGEWPMSFNREASNVVRTLTPMGGEPLKTQLPGSLTCPNSVELVGSGELSAQGATARITATLVA